MEQEIRSYSVQKYLTSIKNKLSETPAVWVHGVITQIVEKPKIVYITIADFEEGDVKPIATISLSCFTGKYIAIRAKTENAPKPFALKEQMKVCFQIKADVYIPAGKLQGQILDVDPIYTLGELAITKSAILKKLAVEGLLEKNKQLELAKVPLRVGLITGETTAAYKDFTTRLEASPFRFQIVTAYAKMQGNETEASVLEALDKLREDCDIDVVCIVRGGGSKTDLNYFDSEALCRAVANFPLPVFTGIGHEIDKSLLDEVAYLSCITPTDCAKRLVERVEESWNEMLFTARKIAERSKSTLVENNRKLSQMGNDLQREVLFRVEKEKNRHSMMAASLQKNTQFIFKAEDSRISRDEEGLRQGSRKILDLAKSKFSLLEVRTKNADPQTAINKGFTLTLDSQGKFIRNAKDLKSGDILTTRFKDGSVSSIVK